MKIDDEFFRDYLLVEACWAGRPVNIDGVRIDLNHAELDRGEWTPIAMIGEVAGEVWGPSIQLPWSRPWQLERLSRRKNVVVVSPGDTILIDAVETVETVAELGKFDHPHHRYRRWARLAVLRADDSRVEVPGVWLFAGVADVLTPIFLHDDERTRTALISRFEEMCGVEDLADSIPDETETEFNSKFSEHKQDMRLLANLLWRAEHSHDNISAMAFGYMIGRSEVKQVRQAQAKVAATSTRSTGDETRRTAIMIIEKTPQIILRRCAEEVSERLGRRETRSVEKTIRVLFSKSSDGSMRPNHSEVEAAKRQLKTRS